MSKLKVAKKLLVASLTCLSLSPLLATDINIGEVDAEHIAKQIKTWLQDNGRATTAPDRCSDAACKEMKEHLLHPRVITYVAAHPNFFNAKDAVTPQEALPYIKEGLQKNQLHCQKGRFILPAVAEQDAHMPSHRMKELKEHVEQSILPAYINESAARSNVALGISQLVADKLRTSPQGGVFNENGLAFLMQNIPEVIQQNQPHLKEVEDILWSHYFMKKGEPYAEDKKQALLEEVRRIAQKSVVFGVDSTKLKESELYEDLKLFYKIAEETAPELDLSRLLNVYDVKDAPLIEEEKETAHDWLPTPHDQSQKEEPSGPLKQLWSRFNNWINNIVIDDETSHRQYIAALHRAEDTYEKRKQDGMDEKSAFCAALEKMIDNRARDLSDKLTEVSQQQGTAANVRSWVETFSTRQKESVNSYAANKRHQFIANIPEDVRREAAQEQNTSDFYEIAKNLSLSVERYTKAFEVALKNHLGTPEGQTPENKKNA